MAYNKDQWISSFEDQLSILRLHLTGRPLASMGLDVWHQSGAKDKDPIEAETEWSQSLDRKRSPDGPIRSARSSALSATSVAWRGRSHLENGQ